MQPFWSDPHSIWKPHPGQQEFLESDARFKVLACGRRWGKTDVCAASIVHALHQPSPTRHLILAPTQDQANLLFDRVLELLEQLGDKRGKIRRTPYPILYRGAHRVMARSGHLGRSLRGQEATHIVIDEAAFIPEALITEVALPMLATTNGQMTLISTPRGMNHFWRFFNFGVAGEHGVWSRKAPSSESPFVVPDFLKIQRGLISERAYRVEYEAEFADSAGRVFRTEAIESCLATELVLPIEKVVIGIDFARYTDYTVAIAMVGDAGACEIREILRIHGASYSVQISQMAEFIEKFGKCQVRFDATGMGGMVYETLVGQCRSASIDGAVFTAPLKSDLIDRLAILVDAGRVKMLPHPELIRELQHFESRTTDKGSKLEAVSGYHDDMVIALALAVSLLPIPYKANILVGEERKLDFSEMFGKVG